ncbi:MAG: multifunctional CCA tRNA nucleotidyl transferase/2'3'-cyclic phosphodiesterase/2'nucleotidase/phosphatase [Burkholderiales bacterium]|jgi:tRNA nucleotidyltransferase (CCA-adding enzyme)|nr:multifunctional CCA tRNA nucleotidyl transferase/2'3'-cyclic phosphodiesterase/2'nucleotidase/phosphatase [Burkholderiales bacterium]
MKIWRVGGSVRDELLGLPVRDRDWVVVGATPDAMLDAGFTPVGRDFPVFLHPVTREEHALARTERKSGPGYRGFTVHAAPDVTLEQDLARRDLTINAMARGDDGTLVDPFGGARDLADRVLRHVSPAFAEDPVRILRVARFAARFDFRVAPETATLMRTMVDAGEADHLVAERVWQEVAKGLMERHPSVMFATLAACGALARVLPELDAATRDPAWAAALDGAAAADAGLTVRFALMARDASDLDALCDRVRAPGDCRALAQLARHQLDALRAADGADPETLARLLSAADAWRRPARFEELLDVLAAVEARPRQEVASARRLHAALRAGADVDAGRIAALRDDPRPIPDRIHAARVDAIARIPEPLPDPDVRRTTA